MQTFIQIIVAIGFFSLLILFHELGHFAAAKWNGVIVHEFNFGMGPKLFTKRYKETAYSLRLLPIGGSVLMMGEDEDDSSPASFNNKKVWQRMSIIFAGPFMNFVLAIIAFIIVFMMLGVPSVSNVLSETKPGYPAAEAGIIAGDIIIEINGRPIDDWQSMGEVINEEAAALPYDTPLVFKVSRQGEELTFEIIPHFDEDKVYRIGVSASTLFEKAGFFKAISLGFVETYEFTKDLLVNLAGMITGKVPADVGGPVMIISIVGKTAVSGIGNLLFLLAVLSVNLGLINLLPIPAMDGSRLVFLAVEGMRGKPFDRRKEGFVHFIGLMLLFALMIFITYKDILRLIKPD
jgi:regulator of sigma E protease